MYLLDANVLITAKNQHYGFDFVPGFWDWIIKAHQSGRVYTVEAVKVELMGLGDDLSQWFSLLPRSFSLPPTTSTTQHFTRLSAWTQSVPHYDGGSVNQFLSAADYPLVAQGAEHSFVVVTHEKPQPQARRIKIPDACAAIGVRFMTPWQMLRAEGARFVL